MAPRGVLMAMVGAVLLVTSPTAIESRFAEGQPDRLPDLAAELVREQLIRVTREELPHSIAVSVEELDDGDLAGGSGPDDEVWRLLVTVRVERDSQKGIVIDYDLVDGANHFWTEHLPEVESRVGAYLDKRLAASQAE